MSLNNNILPKLLYKFVMKRKTKLKWFTLVEMLIVMVIIGILAVVLTESYITISKVALRVEQEKNISEESLILTQIFQSIADEATIDYEAYSGNSIKLSESDWFTDILYLTWGQWSGTSIYTTGECLELEWNFPAKEDGTYPDYSEKIQNATWCALILSKEVESGDPSIIKLTTPGKVITSKVMFRIIPYNTDEYYFEDEGNSTIINDIHQPAFWMFIHLYAMLYQPTGTNKIDQPLQLFFNLKL